MNIIVVNCFDTYEQRVDLLYEVFKENGDNVRILTSNFRHFDKTKRTEQKKDFIFFDANPYRKNLSVRRLLSHYQLSKTIFKYLEKHQERIDLLWVLIPPNSFVKAAALFKKRHKEVRLIFDIIDLWPETMPIGAIKSAFPFALWRRMRDDYLTCAEVVVTECNLYQEVLKKKNRDTQYETLYLARPLKEYTPHLNLPEDRISLCYLGSINNIIDIELISKIISIIRKKTKVDLHIIGDGENRDALIYSAQRAGASVVFHGTIYDREKKQAIFDTCHYGLNIMKETVCVGLTMKSIDYMENGVPLINSIRGDIWEIVEKEGIGFNTDDLNRITLNYNLQTRAVTRRYFEEHLTSSQFKVSVGRIVSNEKNSDSN